MKVKLENKKLIPILKEREVVHKRIGEIMEDLMRLDRERTKEGYKMERLKEKTKLIMDKLDINLGEFEIITRVFLEKDEAYCDIVDMIEDYREAVRAKRKEDEKAKKNKDKK